MTEAQEIERALSRLERAMDEAYSRYATSDGGEREEGVAAALRLALVSVPHDMRSVVLELMSERYEMEEPPPEAPDVEAELGALRLDVRRLERELAEAGRRAPAGDSMIDAMLGEAGAARLRHGAPDATRAAEVVALLADFASELARWLLGSVDHRGGADDGAGRFRDAVVDALEGGSSARLADVLDEVRRSVVAPVRALPAVCQKGGRQLLKELDPLLLEDESRSAGSGLSFGPFRYRDLWETFERRYSRLVNDDDLYQGYFDGPLKAELYRLGRRSRHG